MKDRGQPIRGALLRIGQSVCVRVQRRLHVGMAEPLRNNVNGFAAEE